MDRRCMIRLAVIFTAICLLLVTSLGFTAEPKKTQRSKATIVEQKLKEADKKDQPKPSGIDIVPNQPATEISPVEPRPIRAVPISPISTEGREIKWQVISSGGTDGGSSSYQLGGTVSQTGVGFGSSASYQLKAGFWQSFEECPGRGDATGDGLINSADISYLINYLFVFGPVPQPLCAGDANCDGGINSADVAYLINYLFVNGPPPGCP